MPKLLAMPADQLKEYIRIHAGKKTPEQMYRETGVAPTTIIGYAYEIGVSIVLQSKIDRINKMRDKIIELHETHTAQQVADLLNEKRSSCFYQAFLMGMKFKKEKERGCDAGGSTK